MVPFGALYFLKLGHEIVGCKPHAYRLRGARDRFMSLYGTEPQVVALVWDMLPDAVKKKNGCHPRHLLWTLNFLKAYDTSLNNATRFHCDEKTFRKWTWYMLESIERLHSQVILWRNRFKNHGAEDAQRAVTVVDGTDFPIYEILKNGFEPGWFSPKYNGPAVKYEVATSIRGGDIVWIHGPFPGGKHDLTIFRSALKGMLHALEWVWGDRGYRGDSKIITIYNVPENSLPEFLRGRARHEVMNGRFKRFHILNDVFRHSVHKHYLVFNSVAVILQLETECGFVIPFDCHHRFDSVYKYHYD